MASFSERIGKRTAKTIVQIDNLDKETRTALWDVLVVLQGVITSMPAASFGMDTVEKELTTFMWTRVYKKSRDEMQGPQHIWQILKSDITRGEWFEALDLIEALIKRLDDPDNHEVQELQPVVIEALNDVFKRELVGYRFIGTEISPITNQVEAAAVDEALEITHEYLGARHHLQRSLELFSDRHSPDYLNSIKESISAVEAAVRTISDGRTLTDGLKKLEGAGLKIHSALKFAWEKLYGWASDEQGIRHGGITASDADESLAKYMLISCSAFVSYLIEEANKKDLFQ